MISVADALDHLFALVQPLGTETVPLRQGARRVLRAPVRATRDQPPFAASAMDGYAIAAGGDRFTVIGEAPAGRAFTGAVGPGQAVRIFTGAPLPDGTDAIAIQEDVVREGDRIRLTEPVAQGAHVRAAGGDFFAGAEIAPGRRLSAQDLALAAAMNAPEVTVTRRPVVALLATGDELVMPGGNPASDQIVASNVFGLAALFEEAGAEVRLLPIARDTLPSLQTALGLATGVDLVITIGGASVGDHDLVAEAAEGLGLERAFYKIAMRPGKPLMAGRLQGAAMVGLPGNPVSAMVCGHIFVVPMLRAMLGLGAAPRARIHAPLAHDIDGNGPREHYMRAEQTEAGLAVFSRQDSALLSVLAGADHLVIRPPHDGPRGAGATVEAIALNGVG